MTSVTGTTSDSGRAGFFRKHRVAAMGIGIAIVFAVALSIYVLAWFAGNAVSTGLVPSLLGFWTMGNLITFILYAIFWELLLVGVPVVVLAVIVWRWWRSLPAEDKWGFGTMKSRSKSAGGGGGLSFVFFLVFVIKVYLDGNWNRPISTFTLDYVVGSTVNIFLWGVLVIGIPVAVISVWWLGKK